MKIFLTSLALLSEYENDVKIGSEINKMNSFCLNLQQNCKKCDNFVYICNNPSDFEDNDISGKFAFDAFNNYGFDFKKLDIIDGRNAKKAKAIIQNADLIFLRGGKLECQIKFLKKYKIDKHLHLTNAIIIGQSAGAMVLSKSVYQYPETKEEFGLKRFIKGCDFFDIMIIPHFNPTTGNDICDGTFNPLNDFILPDSAKNKFLALENGSYIILDDNNFEVYGNAYLIENQVIQKICSTNKCLQI